MKTKNIGIRALLVLLLAVMLIGTAAPASACIDYSLNTGDLSSKDWTYYFPTGYKWENFLNGYNYIVFGDEDVENDLSSTIHCMGAVLVNGNLNFNGQGYADSGKEGQPVPPPSYISGKVVSGYHNQRSGKSFPLYVGSVNDPDRVSSYIAPVHVSDNFFDFETAYSVVNAASANFKNQSTSTAVSTPHAYFPNGAITIPYGSSITLYENVMLGSDVNSPWDDPVIWLYGPNIEATTIINIIPDADGKIQMPKVVVSSSLNERPKEFNLSDYANGTDSESSDIGCNIIWNIPDATSVDLAQYSASVGHFFAQNAAVTGHSSNFNSTIICKTYSGDVEGHIFPFTGDASVVFTANKTVVGNPEQNETFKFVLSAVTPGAPMPNQTTATAAAGKTAVFGKVNYTSADVGNTYYYKITEEAGSNSNFTYDSSEYSIKVAVTSNSANQVIATKTITKTSNGSSSSASSVDFVNIYRNSSSEVQATSLALNVNKTVTGNPPANAAFSFSIKADTAGAPMPAQTSVTIAPTAAGNFTAAFGSIAYESEGVYEYTVTEAAGQTTYVEGDTTYTVSYDSSEYKVIVTVTRNGDQLVATPSYKKNGSPVNAIAFTNSITSQTKAQATSLTLGVNKAVTGNPPTDAEFSFSVKADTVGAPMPAQTSVTIAPTASGNYTATFGSIAYESEGVYEYTVTEAAGQTTYVEGDTTYTVSYDNSEYKVIVTVTRNGNQLVATPVFKKGGTTVNSLAFTNAVTSVEGGGEEEETTLVLRKVDKHDEDKGLPGAVYGLFTDENCKELITTLGPTNDNGYSATVKVEPGTYWVRELTPPDGYGLDYEPTKIVVEEGKDNIVVVVNTYGPYSLTIVKAISGTTTTKQFSFSLEMSIAEGVDPSGMYVKVKRDNGTETIDRIYSNDLHADGELNFKLADGDILTVEAIPAGVQYIVTEAEDADFITTVNGIAGNTASGSITNSSVSATFTNTYQEEEGPGTEDGPETGDAAQFTLWISMIAASALVLCTLRRRQNSCR